MLVMMNCHSQQACLKHIFFTVLSSPHTHTQISATYKQLRAAEKNKELPCTTEILAISTIPTLLI